MGASALGLAVPCSTWADGATEGLVMGEPKGAEAGQQVLRQGGNAIDAIVAAALAACVHAPNQCGIGGYGGHMMIRLANGRLRCIDFNSAAPRAARADMFSGDGKQQLQMHGWLSAGIPGVLAGLQFALKHYGTKRFGEVAAPAIQLAEEGFPITTGLSRAIQSQTAQLKKDPASARLLLANGEALKPESTLRNPQLAGVLKRLARDNSVDDFYRGEIARIIAMDFERHGGLVTEKDLAAYRAREVPPLKLVFAGHEIYTAPLTAGGFTMVQALAVLARIVVRGDIERDHAVVEALQRVWKDRLERLGDPEFLRKSFQELLSNKYVSSAATDVQKRVERRRRSAEVSVSKPHTGTLHLNAADAKGNWVAITLTHGNTFGACVTVDGLGLTLGHGMSRFNADPQHPNAPGPGKRPLDNMCPTIVLRDGKPTVALGAAGGRLIVNSVFFVLWHHLHGGKSIEEAVAAPRLHTEGGAELAIESRWPEDSRNYLREIGYQIRTGGAAAVRAIAADADGWKAFQR